MPHLFLSYAHADNARVFALHAELEHLTGHYIWIDKEELHGGIEWERSIRLGIEESYGVIFAMTTAFFRSEYIVQKEIPWSLERFQAETSRGEARIFPLLLDRLTRDTLSDSAQAMFDAVMKFQYIEATGSDWSGIAAALRPLLPEPGDGGHNFIVNWPRLKEFKGRGEVLKALHDTVKRQNNRAGGHASISGMGGVGKTQLAVEYAHRYRFHFPAGVYWLNGARDWKGEVADLADRLRLTPADGNAPDRAGQMAAALNDYLRNQGGDALLVLDNVDQPGDVLRREIGPAGLRLVDLPARLLITTRRADLPTGFESIPVTTLEREPEAARAILREARPNAPNSELDEVCRALGYLPLALLTASRALNKRKEMSLAALLKYLREYGLDAVAQRTKIDETMRLSAILDWHWDQLDTDTARHLIALAAAYAEATVIPLARLRILADMPYDPDALDQPFDDAVLDLRSANLVEDAGEGAIRLHPLVREYVQHKVPDYGPRFLRAAEHIAAAYRQPDEIYRQAGTRGFRAVLADITTTESIVPYDQPVSQRLQAMSRLFTWEAYHLHDWTPDTHGSAYLIQHVRERAHHQLDDELTAACDTWLRDHARCTFQTEPRWRLPFDPSLIRVFEGHTGYIQTIAFTHTTGSEPTLAVSGSDDTTLRLWNLEGDAIRQFNGHGAEVLAAAITPDNRFLLSGGLDSTLIVWDMQTGELLRRFEEPSPITCLAIAPDAPQVAVGHQDNSICLLNYETGAELWRMRRHGGTVHAVAISPDGALVASGSADRSVRLWDRANGERVNQLNGHRDQVYAVQFTPDGGRLLSGSGDMTLRLWDVRAGRELRTLTGHTGRVAALAVDRTGTRALSASHDTTIRLWNLETGTERRCISGHGRAIHSLALSPDQQVFLSGSADKTLRLWRLSALADAPNTVRHGHQATVNAAAASADGRTVLTASDDKTLRLWDAETGEERRRFEGTNAIRAATLTPNARLILTGSFTRSLTLLDAETGERLRTLEGHTRAVKSVALTPDGRYALSAGYDLTLRVWDMESGAQLHNLKGHDTDVRVIAVTSDSRYAITGAADQTLRLWDIVAGTGLKVFRGHSSIINGVAITPDDRYVLSASRDYTVRLWELASGHELRRFEGHTSRVNAVLCSPDGQYALSASSDKTLRLWNVLNGASLAILRLETIPTTMCRLPDASGAFRVFVGDVGGGVRVLRVFTPS